jgi:hypothetical protein
VGDGRQSIQRDLSSDHGTVLKMRGDHSPYCFEHSTHADVFMATDKLSLMISSRTDAPIILNFANSWDPQFMNRSSTKPRFFSGLFHIRGRDP